jgi:hypothetical protein
MVDGENNVKGQQPHRLDMVMSDNEFSKLKDYARRGKVQEFTQWYKEQYPELSNDDVISLAVIKSINSYDFSLPKKLFAILYETDSTNPHPLVTLDGNGNNAVLCSLKTGISIEYLSGYVFGLNRKNKLNEKFVMDDDLVKKLAYIIKYPVSETHPVVLMRKLIEPLYTKESVEELIDVIGQDWLDSYYT